MTNQTNNNQFRDDEIVIMSHWDKKEEKWVKSIFPKVGGRLRLAHEDNENMSITTEIIRYDENIAVVRAVTATSKGAFPGFGMASVERDHTIAPAILELAETRAIARSLRFAGYGVEYCSAEEVSHLENGNGNSPRPPQGNTDTDPKNPEEPQTSKPGNGGNGGKGGNGDARITNKQLSYLVDLGRNLNMDSRGLDDESLKLFGVKMAYLTVKDASAFIDALKSMAM
ncbi:MAG: hypothetical protein JW882_05840 [Deltaproteobacteria bacterium]|nr:hypothetical protein [Deltaproteobacteria bacterium]